MSKRRKVLLPTPGTESPPNHGMESPLLHYSDPNDPAGLAALAKMSKRRKVLLPTPGTESPQNHGMESPLLHYSDPNDPAGLAALAVLHVPVLPDDLYHIIRAVVPPPPSVDQFAGHTESSSNLNHTLDQNCAPRERLFSRRPSEETLIDKVNWQSPNVSEAKVNLEELFIQLIEPKRYSDENVVEHSVLHLMEHWPWEKAIQEQSLACLTCLDEQTSSFSLSQASVSNTLGAMKHFPHSEKIQRLGVKLLVNQKLLDKGTNRIDLACLVFNSLCDIPGTDDFMLYARKIVRDMEPANRAILKACKRFVGIMLDFPCRRNDQITVYLCWCALDTLILLAEHNDRWNEFVELDGQIKLERLSLRPELEDRCKILLDRVLPAFCGTASTSNLMHTRPGELVGQYSVEKQSVPELQAYVGDISQNGTAAKIPERISEVICASNLAVKSSMRSVHELIISKPPTPPPTVSDYHEEYHDHEGFSDDEATLSFVPSSPLSQCAGPSPSYSPPPEINALLLKEYREILSPAFPRENGTNALCNNHSTVKTDIPTRTIPTALEECPSKLSKSVKSNSYLNNKDKFVIKCIFCNESKAKQPLLVKQLKQISHCLYQPCNFILMKCLESNLCKDHRVLY